MSAPGSGFPWAATRCMLGKAMKTLGQLSPRANSLAVAVSLVLFAGGTYAAGPAGGGLAGSTNGMASGPSAGTVSGAGLSGAGRGGGSRGPAASGARPGVSISNSGAGQHLGGGAFTRGNGAGRGTGFSPSGLSMPYRNVPNQFAAPSAATNRATGAPTLSRPANLWSGTAVASTNSNGFAISRNPGRPSNRANNNWTANGFTGQRLYSGAYGANLPTYNQGNHGGRGNHGYHNGNNRFSSRYSYYPYAYGPYYAPYINYFGGSYGAAYPYYNDVPFADTSYENSPAATVAPQYTEPAPADANNDQPDATQPAPQRQQTPDANNGGTIPNNGPDSLVEAVQEELVRRGYYGGKVDAMFSPDTKEALRKFQADRHLAATGLINEATLHALQLD